MWLNNKTFFLPQTDLTTLWRNIEKGIRKPDKIFTGNVKGKPGICIEFKNDLTTSEKVKFEKIFTVTRSVSEFADKLSGTERQRGFTVEYEEKKFRVQFGKPFLKIPKIKIKRLIRRNICYFRIEKVDEEGFVYVFIVRRRRRLRWRGSLYFLKFNWEAKI